MSITFKQMNYPDKTLKSYNQRSDVMSQSELSELVMEALELTTGEWDEFLKDSSSMAVLEETFAFEYPRFYQEMRREHGEYMSIYG